MFPKLVMWGSRSLITLHFPEGYYFLRDGDFTPSFNFLGARWDMAVNWNPTIIHEGTPILLELAQLLVHGGAVEVADSGN